MATIARNPSRLNNGSGASPSSKPAAAAAPAEDELNPYRWIILIAVLTGAFLELLDTTSVNVALRQMAGNLGATTDEIGWVATGYILSNVIVLPLTAWACFDVRTQELSHRVYFNFYAGF